MATLSFTRHGAVLFPLLVTIAASSFAAPATHMIAVRLLHRVKPMGISLTLLQDADLLLIAVVRFLRNGQVDCQKYALVALDAITVDYESKSVASRYPGLLEAVVASGEACESEATVVLMNFAMDSKSKAATVGTRGLLALLQRVASSKDQCTSCNACSVLEYLSSDLSVRDAIVKFEAGAIVHTLVNLVRDDQSDIRSKALQTISNLVCETTANAIGNIPDIFEQLADIAVSQPSTFHSAIAAKGIKRLSVYIQTRHKSHHDFCDSLVRMSACSGLDVCLWTARAYVEQTLRVSSSFILVRSDSNIAGLLALARSKHIRVRVSAVEAIANLAQEAANAKRLSTNDAVFDILIKSINETEEDDGGECVRREAVRAILLMANHRAASKRVAKQSGLIRSLSQYGTSIDGDVDLKRAALHGVLVLAPSM